MQDLDRDHAVGVEMRLSAVVKYGRIAVVALGFILVAVVFLPNGSYWSGSSVAHINALSSPFVDYGGTEIGVVVVVAFLALIVWARRWRTVRTSAWGSVFVCAGLLGTLLPDSWTRNTISVSKGVRHQVIGVRLQYGFWLNLSLVATLFVISSIVLWNETRLGSQTSLRRIDIPSKISN
jgi:di/tricarboxylate transporter